MWWGASPDFMAKARSFLNVKNDEEVLRRFHDDFRRVYSRYAGPDQFNPVSYTHLDVYKRQASLKPVR